MGKIANRENFYLLIVMFFLALLYADLSMAVSGDIIGEWDEKAIKTEIQNYKNRSYNKNERKSDLVLREIMLKNNKRLKNKKRFNNKKRYQRKASPKYVTTRTYRRYTLKPYKSPLHGSSIYQTNYVKK